MHHEEGPASPMVAFMAPKMDTALTRVASATGWEPPLEREQYPTLVFLAGCAELLGGILFTLNSQLGALLLVRRRALRGVQRVQSCCVYASVCECVQPGVLAVAQPHRTKTTTAPQHLTTCHTLQTKILRPAVIAPTTPAR